MYARCFYFAWLKSPGRQSLRGGAGGVCRCRTAAQWLLLSSNCPTQSSGYYDRWQGLEKENTEVSFPVSFPTRRVPCAHGSPYHEKCRSTWFSSRLCFIILLHNSYADIQNWILHYRHLFGGLSIDSWRWPVFGTIIVNGKAHQCSDFLLDSLSNDGSSLVH